MSYCFQHSVHYYFFTNIEPIIVNVISNSSRSAPVSNRNSLHRRSQSVGLFLDRLATAPSAPARAASNEPGVPVTSSATRKKSDRRRCQRNQRTEVWSWGAGDKGQAGQGDVLDRLQPSMVSALSADGSAVQGWKIMSSLAQIFPWHQKYLRILNPFLLSWKSHSLLASVTDLFSEFACAPQKVTCGSDHSLALTLTGSVFAWGDNSSGQLANSPPGGQKICSTPTEVPLPTGETARDIAAFENR